MKVFLDHNVVLPRILCAGGAWEISDFAGGASSDLGARLLDDAVDGRFALVTSDVALETLRRKLIDPNVGEPLDPESAVQTADMFNVLATASGGGTATVEAVKAQIARVLSTVPAEHVGRGVDQIDHEDVTVLAGCLAHIDSIDDYVTLITNDRGLLAVARYLVNVGIAVCRPDVALRGLRAAVAA